MTRIQPYVGNVVVAPRWLPVELVEKLAYGRRGTHRSGPEYGKYCSHTDYLSMAKLELEPENGAPDVVKEHRALIALDAVLSTKPENEKLWAHITKATEGSSNKSESYFEFLNALIGAAQSPGRWGEKPTGERKCTLTKAAKLVSQAQRTLALSQCPDVNLIKLIEDVDPRFRAIEITCPDHFVEGKRIRLDVHLQPLLVAVEKWLNKKAASQGWIATRSDQVAENIALRSLERWFSRYPTAARNECLTYLLECLGFEGKDIKIVAQKLRRKKASQSAK